MAKHILITSPSGDDIGQHDLLNLSVSPSTPSTIIKFPTSIIESIETNRQRHLLHSRSATNISSANRLTVPTNDTNSRKIQATKSNENQLLTVDRYQRTPFETNNQTSIETSTEKEHPRRSTSQSRFNRRMNSSFAMPSSPKPLVRRRSTFSSGSRRPSAYLPRTSKWRFIRKHLRDIALMSENYARVKSIERDLRWIHLREAVFKHVVDMREISILRQQEQGLLTNSTKTTFDLKAIPPNEVVHIERDGRIHSISTRELVLGRLTNAETVDLDIFAQLDARRKLKIKQSLLKQKEGRARLKKQIAFAVCFCNLSFIMFMFIAMVFCSASAIIELKSRNFP